jgi:hypothetical protein
MAIFISPDYACLEVSDTNCEIPDKDIEKLFDPFFTTKFTGRGLGLSVLMGIVKAHGGGFTVESEPGRRSVLRVFLPVSTEEVIFQPGLPAMPEAQQTVAVELVFYWQVQLGTTGRSPLIELQCINKQIFCT